MIYNKCFTGDSPSPLTIPFTYPVGATGFVLVGDYDYMPEGLPDIDAETGEVTVYTSSLPVGTYTIMVKYFIGEDEFYAYEVLTISGCATVPIKTEFVFCEGSGEQTTNLVTNDGTEVTNWELVDGAPSEVTVSSDGQITIDTTSNGEYTFDVIYGDEQTASITIKVVVCPEPTELLITECERESIGIVWINQDGGRQSYWFNQPKVYEEDQKDGETWINNNKEKRYYNRGRVEDAIQINQDFIPIEHIGSLGTLKRAIQAWYCTDIADQSTYQAIILEEDSYTQRKTTSRFYTVGFRFAFAKAKVIQRQ